MSFQPTEPLTGNMGPENKIILYCTAFAFARKSLTFFQETLCLLTTFAFPPKTLHWLKYCIPFCKWTQNVLREHKRFMNKHKVSLENANILPANVKFLWKKLKFRKWTRRFLGRQMFWKWTKFCLGEHKSFESEQSFFRGTQKFWKWTQSFLGEQKFWKWTKFF